MRNRLAARFWPRSRASHRDPQKFIDLAAKPEGQPPEGQGDVGARPEPAITGPWAFHPYVVAASLFSRRGK